MKLFISLFVLLANLVVAQSNQSIFESKRAQFKDQYLSAKNDIKRSSVFNNANEWSRNFSKNSFNPDEYWYGKITSISTDQGGSKASVTIQSDSYGVLISYETDNEVFTTYDDLVIKRGTKLYDQISDLAEGENVKFKFHFVDSSDRGVFEKSITEYGSITEPEFMVKFISIEPAN